MTSDRIGLFGGTFNPIHLGHLRAAEEVRERLALDRVRFIPSAVPPHKRGDAEDPIASADQRLEWVETAIAAHPDFVLDRIEIDRAGPSFLVDTLEAIRARDSSHGSSRARAGRAVFIVGADAFAEMGDWRAPERLFALTDFAVMTRPPGQLEDLEDGIPAVVRDAFEFRSDGRRAEHKQAGTSIELVTISALEISSSSIRERCRLGKSIRYLVPESIRTSIERYAGYGTAGS